MTTISRSQMSDQISHGVWVRRGRRTYRRLGGVLCGKLQLQGIHDMCPPCQRKLCTLGRLETYRRRVGGVGERIFVHLDSVISQQGTTPEEDVDSRQRHIMPFALHNLQDVRRG